MAELKTNFIFPTPLWQIDVDNSRELNAQLHRSIHALRDADPAGRLLSNVGGWQSMPDLHTRPEFTPFMAVLDDVARRIDEKLRIQPHLGLRVQCCWANINDQYAYNRPHTHPNCFFSGVYYVRAEPNCGQIYFMDPRSGAHPQVLPSREICPYNFNEMYYDATEGRLFVFPGWLLHYVDANASGMERISISFNFDYRLKE